jgi:hypothetical protein
VFAGYGSLAVAVAAAPLSRVLRALATCDTLWWRLSMTTFDEREKAYEKKFALDQDLKFKAEARRNKMLAEWAAGKLGITGLAVEDYIKAVRKADLAEKGDHDLFRKIRKDFDDNGINVSDAEIRKAMVDFLAEAVRQVEAAAKQ